MNSAKSSNFARVAAISPQLSLGNVHHNSEEIIKKIKSHNKDGVEVIVFPELCLTGYTCGDLFLQDIIHSASQQALLDIVDKTKKCTSINIIGMPFKFDGRLFNCAIVIGQGNIYGVVPKVFMPNTNEFYEKRWFSSGASIKGLNVEIGNHTNIPFGIDLIFESFAKNWKLGIEICEDLWSVIPPSSLQALNGANIIANLSASNDLVGKSKYRRDLVSQQSARCVSGYIYTSSGFGESTTDLVFSGHRIIAENGIILNEDDNFSSSKDSIVADLDIKMLDHDRYVNTGFKSSHFKSALRLILLENNSNNSYEITRVDKRHPFVPSDKHERKDVCDQIFNIQSAGLAQRLKHMGFPKPVIGISGGLDSTLALLVTVKAQEMLSRSNKDIHAITMPGFGTSKRTSDNSKNLIEGLGLEFNSISINDAVKQHFNDINHDETNHDVVYENSQARERTKILMDVANQKNGMVVGTGDLSEAALGWCTFNGDHMSMYHVNIGVPKTLVQYIIESCIKMDQFKNISDTLISILETPISPELLPPDESGKIIQETELTVGPYEVHDFFLYHFCRYGRSPKEIFDRACKVFKDDFDEKSILGYLEIFYKRFFSQQFKRSTMPDGPKVGSIALSPRGDWRMPSDASSTLWQNELIFIKKNL